DFFLTERGKDIKITIYRMALKRVSTCADAFQRGNQRNGVVPWWEIPKRRAGNLPWSRVC
ncbi:MAG: hypothetical protein K2I07_01865, partial [Lachnospiraceae bacterium]|nr:hypothetical protein [Lachnospiraceae bacterium]